MTVIDLINFIIFFGFLLYLSFLAKRLRFAFEEHPHLREKRLLIMISTLQVVTLVALIFITITIYA